MKITILIPLFLVLCFFMFNCDPAELEPEEILDPEPTEEPGPTTPPEATPAPLIESITIHENDVRQPLGTGSSLILEAFLVDKKAADTVLLIEGTISGYGNHSGSMTQGWQYGSGAEVVGQSIMYDDSNNSRIYTTSAVIRGHNVTGPQLMTFRYFSESGASSNRPFNIYNPNSTDDARLAQTCSRYVIWEIRE